MSFLFAKSQLLASKVFLKHREFDFAFCCWLQDFAMQKQSHLDLWHFLVCAETIFCQNAMINLLG